MQNVGAQQIFVELETEPYEIKDQNLLMVALDTVMTKFV